MKSSLRQLKKDNHAQSNCGMNDLNCNSKMPPQFKLETEQAGSFDTQSALGKRNTQLPEAIQAKMENSLGADFSNVDIVKDSPQATQAGAKAFTQGDSVHFAPGQFKTDQKGQELIGHEFQHVVQQREGRVTANASVNNMPLNNEKSLESEADTKGAMAAQGKVANEGTQSSHAASGPAQFFMESSLDGMPARVAKDLSVAVPTTEGNKGLFAEAGKADESNKKLEATGAHIRLEETGETAKVENNGSSKTLKKFIPVNSFNGTEGDNMELFADCGRANSMITGSLDRNAKYTDLKGNAQQTESGDPAVMKYEIFTHVFDTLRSDPEYKDDSRIQRFVKLFDKYKADSYKLFGEISKETDSRKLGRLKKRQKLAWQRMLEVYDRLPGKIKTKFDQELGINAYANPEIGEGYTMSSGGNDHHGMSDQTWNFHWAGVVMKSSDGKDNITLENYSVGDWDAQNTEWSFNMYGPAEEHGQSFHDQMNDTKAFGKKPTTMAAGRNFGSSRRGS